MRVLNAIVKLNGAMAYPAGTKLGLEVPPPAQQRGKTDPSKDHIPVFVEDI